MKKTTVLLAAVLITATMARAEEATTTEVAAPATTAAATSEAATTTATAADATKEATKNWSVGFLNYIEAKVENANHKNGRIDTTNYFSGNYKLTDKTSIGFRQYFSYTPKSQFTEKEIAENKKESEIGDTMLLYNTPSGKILGSDDIALQLRALLPTSQASKDGNPDVDGDGLVGHVAGIFDIPWTINKTWMAELIVWPSLNFLENNVTNGAVFNYGQINYTINDNWSLYHLTGVKTKVAKVTNTAETKKSADLAEIESGVNWSPIKNLALTLAVTQESDLRASQSFAVYRDAESAYYLQTYVSF